MANISATTSAANALPAELLPIIQGKTQNGHGETLARAHMATTLLYDTEGAEVKGCFANALRKHMTNPELYSVWHGWGKLCMGEVTLWLDHACVRNEDTKEFIEVTTADFTAFYGARVLDPIHQQRYIFYS